MGVPLPLAWDFVQRILFSAFELAPPSLFVSGIYESMPSFHRICVHLVAVELRFASGSTMTWFPLAAAKESST